MVRATSRSAHHRFTRQIAGGRIVGVIHWFEVAVCPSAALSRGHLVGEIYPYDMRLLKYKNEFFLWRFEW